MSDEDFANDVRARIARRLRDLDLTPITAATNAGLPRDTLRNLFRGQGSLPRVDTLAAIAQALETTVAYLVGETSYSGLDYSEEDQLAVARTAIQVARPIPVVGYAEWGRFEPLSENEAATPIDFLHFNVPGLEDARLYAVLVNDDHANLEYKRGDYLIAAHSADVGIRDGDHVVVMHRRQGAVEWTVRQEDMGAYRARTGRAATNGGLISLSDDKDRYPNWTRYGGSRSSVFPAEPPDNGWGKGWIIDEDLRAAIEAGEIPGVTHDYEEPEDDDDGWEPPAFLDDHLQVLGVVVASVAFFVRPTSPGLLSVPGLSPQDSLDILLAKKPPRRR